MEAATGSSIIVTNTDSVPGRQIEEVLGVVRGNTVRARWFGRDILAGIKAQLGGEIASYTSMMDAARDEATERMVAQAQALRADGVVNVRYTSSQVMAQAAEILAYGTAVKLTPAPQKAG